MKNLRKSMMIILTVVMIGSLAAFPVLAANGHFGAVVKAEQGTSGTTDGTQGRPANPFE